MNKVVWLLGFSVACCWSPAFASDLTLTDGRILKAATIRSQTPRTVIVLHAAGLSSVSKIILPPDLQKQYPVDEAAAREAELRSEQASAKACVFELAEAERLARLQAKRQEVAGINARLADRQAMKEKEKTDLPLNGAKMRAEYYFRTEYDPVAKANNVDKVSVTISELRLVAGWDKRWFVKGKCDIQFYEVVTEYPSYTKEALQEYSRFGRSADYSPRATRHYTTEVREFEAVYSTDYEHPGFDVTLR